MTTHPGPTAPRPGTRARRAAIREVQRERHFKERVRIGVRGIGEVLITLGLVLLLFCGYQLFYTDLTAKQAVAGELDDLSVVFEQAAQAPVTGPIPPLTGVEKGEPFAKLYVPRFGEGWVRPVLEGVGMKDLHKGIGHYRETVLPGQVGNFSIAGHRTTNGHPFRKIDDLVPGDRIYVETKDAWYTYVVTESRIVVKPVDVYVIAPVPDKARLAEKPTERLITLTSCHPPYSARERMITHGVLENARPRAAGPPPGAPGSTV